MKKLLSIFIFIALFSSCAGSSDSFTGWQTEEFSETKVTESVQKSFILANNSTDDEQHIRAIAFDRGSNATGHFRIARVQVGNEDAGTTDIVIPPGSFLKVTIAYAPMNLETSEASYGGWVTGQEERWTPRPAEQAELWGVKPLEAIHRAIFLAVYDFPREGIYYVQLVGKAVPGPRGEEEAGGAFASCTSGGGTACYTGGFALDIPELAPGGPKALELTGPIRMSISGGTLTMRMDDFPYVLMSLKSTEIPQLPAGVTATLVLSGSEGIEAQGTFDGSRIAIEGVAFRIRVALGELTADQIRQGISSLVDFNISDLKIETIKPLEQGEITMRMETQIPENPSGNELFDQFLSGAGVTAVMEGELVF